MRNFIFFLFATVVCVDGFHATFSKPNTCTGTFRSIADIDEKRGDIHACSHFGADSKSYADSELNTRRKILRTIAASTILPISAMNVGIDNALASQTAGEAVRRSAANIPGYGQPDIYFPSSFIGKWSASRVIVASDDPLISQLLLPATINYDVRFITVDGDTKSDGNQKIIADRQFNEASFYNAIRAELTGKDGANSSTTPSLQSITWSPFNPNVCTSNYSNGSLKEIKVTKRASELDSASGIISSSEYRRVTTVDSGSFGGIPSISASRVLTKWKSEGEGKEQVVEGIEIVYTDGTLGGDPMAVGIGSGANSKPQMSSKSRLRLVKVED